MAGSRSSRNTPADKATGTDAPTPDLVTERSGGDVEGSGAPSTPAHDGSVPGEPAVSTADDLEGQHPTVATPDAGHEDQVPTAEPEGIRSPDEQPALSADTEWVDYDTPDGDTEGTAKHLLDAADSIDADVEREVLVIGGGFRVSKRVADAAGL